MRVAEPMPPVAVGEVAGVAEGIKGVPVGVAESVPVCVGRGVGVAVPAPTGMVGVGETAGVGVNAITVGVTAGVGVIEATVGVAVGVGAIGSVGVVLSSQAGTVRPAQMATAARKCRLPERRIVPDPCESGHSKAPYRLRGRRIRRTFTQTSV